jgi:hypothetical protein
MVFQPPLFRPTTQGSRTGVEDYVLTHGDVLQLRVRSNDSRLWDFNYREPVTQRRITKG